MKNLEEKLNKIKPSALSDAKKDALWARIESGIGERQISVKKAPVVFGMSVRFATSIALVIVLLTSGSIFTVSAANASRPGEWLFPADEFVENVGLVFVGGDIDTARRVEIAKERLTEAQSVVVSPETTNGLKEINASYVVMPEYALNAALGRMELIRSRLLNRGSAEAVSEVDGAINELLGLAQDHVTYLDEVDEEIEAEQENTSEEDTLELREQIRQSRQEIKFKFDYIAIDDSDEGSNEEVGSGNATSGRSLGTQFDVEDQEWKAYLCHISSGEQYTIAVGSPAAERAHLAHGDSEGACGSGSPDVRGASTKRNDDAREDVNDKGRATEED